MEKLYPQRRVISGNALTLHRYILYNNVLKRRRMVLSTLTAISPVDGRYWNKAEALAAYFSEFALIRYRVRVEIEYLIALSEYLPQLSDLNTEEIKTWLRNVYLNFSEDDALRIKDIEKVTNHDVKAVEYFIKEKTDHFLAEKYHEFIHFGLTSQDINNTAFPLSLKEAMENVYYPGLQEVINSTMLMNG